MSTSTGGHSRFPALVIVCVLLLACLYLGQLAQPWMARVFPGVVGVAKFDVRFIILDSPVRVPFMVDLVLVPALFIFMYVGIILLYPRQRMSRRRLVPYRLGAIFAGVVIIACCVAFGSLLSFVLRDHLSRNANNSLESVGLNAELYLSNKITALHGNAIALLFLLIGTAIALGKINRSPVIRRPAPLTRQQRMTPYQRMMAEKRRRAKYGEPPVMGSSGPANAVPGTAGISGRHPVAANPVPHKRALSVSASRAFCIAEPLPRLEPEAVNFRPLW